METMGYEEISEARQRLRETRERVIRRANYGENTAAYDTQPLRVRVERELTAALCEVNRLKELLERLDQNPDFERILELLGMEKL